MPPVTPPCQQIKRFGRAAAAILLFALSRQAACYSADGSFPYVAYVTQDDTYVRSGPGGNFYPTGQLSAGYAVEVYRHEGDGWCVIRPVEGSYSLAPSHQVRILDSRTAEVIAPSVPARIGSALTQDRKAVQVLLERREMVQLLEPPKPSEPFVKIAPPAGEFRFVAASRLSRLPPTEGGSPSSTWRSGADGTSVEPAQYNEPLPPVDADNPFAHLDAALGNSQAGVPASASDSTWGPNAAGAAAPPAAASGLANPPDTITVIPGSPAATQLSAPTATAPGLLSSTASVPAGPGNSPAAGQPRIRFEGLTPPTGPFDSRVAEMQLRLSQIVIQPPATWQLAALREEAATLLAQGETPELRDQLRDLLDRIATFESVQKRYRGVTVAATSPAGATAPLSPSIDVATSPSAEQPGMTGQSADVLARVRNDLGGDNAITPTPGAPPASDLAATDAKYDAVGTLKPVVSKRAQAPRYALVDDHGDVVTFVTASPEINLQAYVGKRIGVLGNRGFMPEYRRAHVTASRVTPLEERLVR